MEPLVLAPLLGAVIGLALGMLGGGGSILTVPALVYLLGQDAHTAVGTSLVIVGSNALAGAWLHHRAGHVQIRQALLFAGAGLGAAYGGARLSLFLSSALLLVLFGGLMLVVAGLMLRQASPAAGLKSPTATWPRILLGGIGVGFLTGFLGVGGGFVIVPALVVLLGMDMRDAIGSSLVVIALNSLAGLLGHLNDGGLNWPLIGLMIVGGVAGILGGTWAARHLPTTLLRRAFAVFVVGLGTILLVINLPAVLA